MTQRNWRERLDARIQRCPGCDDWCWDGDCRRCVPVATVHRLPERHDDPSVEVA